MATEIIKITAQTVSSLYHSRAKVSLASGNVSLFPSGAFDIFP
ncbi:MAG: hypothetical protein ACLQED_02920 [Desulfobaccales bacterium]|jgi:hypothetical protein